MATLHYQGHGSFRLTLADGRVLYVDPFAGEGYDLPADWILVTHDHYDHNQTQLVAKKPGCRIITWAEALTDGCYRCFDLEGLRVTAVPAYNRNHPRASCVGYVLEADGVTLYAAGDTSTTDAMGTTLRDMHLDYALLPIDGVYNMDAREASRCAALIGAAHTVPIHTKPGALYDRAYAETFTGPDRLLVEPGEDLHLTCI